MNIVLYVNSFLPTVGGKEIVVHYLANELQKSGNRVRIVGPSGWLKKRKYKYGYPVHRWPTLKGFYPEKVGYTQLLLDTAIWGCDVVHAHSTYPNGYLASVLKQKYKLPLVITPHGHDIHMIPEIGFGQRLDPVRRGKIERAIKSAEVATAISDSVESSLIDTGCAPEKIHKIPNGIDIERFSARSLPDVRLWLNLEDDARLILSVGNYHLRKGQDIILEAMPRILAQIPTARLVIVGCNQEPLAAKVRELKLASAVRLTGAIQFPFGAIAGKDAVRNIGADHLAALYSQSDLYVSASINKEAEGLSLAILDALATGLPVVATRISGNCEVVQEGQTGFLVPPADAEKLADAVITMLAQKNRAKAMGVQGKSWAEKYHWRAIAKLYMEAYLEAIEKTRKA